MSAGTLSDGEPFQRRAPALEKKGTSGRAAPAAFRLGLTISPTISKYPALKLVLYREAANGHTEEGGHLKVIVDHQ